jgi:hypothetical protein
MIVIMEFNLKDPNRVLKTFDRYAYMNCSNDLASVKTLGGQGKDRPGLDRQGSAEAGSDKGSLGWLGRGRLAAVGTDQG